MSLYRTLAFAGVSLIALSTPAFADSISDSRVQAANNDSADIVVMARRKEEKLQDVPKVVAVVGAADLQKNNIVKFEDIQSLTPGVNLQNSGNGLVQNTSMRGVSFDVNSGMNSSVEFYWNDGGTQQNYIYQAMYDVGQIEVLKGPQGTLRGRASPSGSITVTTKAPDLYRVGGYFEGSIGSSFYGMNEKAALNLPIIQGKVALRLAGMIDDNEGDGVRSAFQTIWPTKPYRRTWSGRVSLRMEPTDNLQINLTYQRLVTHQLNYEQTQSTCLFDTSVSCGQAAGFSATPFNIFGINYTPDYAGVISANQRLSTVAGPRLINNNFEMANARVDWHVLGQKLSYVGQYSLAHMLPQNPYDQTGIYIGGDYPGYYAAGGDYYQTVQSRNQYQTHEIRLSSEQRLAGLFDYVVGFMTMDSPTNNAISSPPSVLTAAQYGVANGFGLLSAFGLTSCNSYAGTYTCNSGPLAQYADRKEDAFYGNLTAHLLEDKLELSGGVRHLVDKNLAYFPGRDDLNLVAAKVIDPSATDASLALKPLRSSAWIWTGSASYHFNSNVLGYFNAGSSFRQGLPSIGPAFSTLLWGGTPQSVMNAYSQTKDEHSTSYEVGIKTTFLNRRGIFNLSYYHQDFTNFQYSAPTFVWVMSNAGSFGASPVAVNGFVASVPVKVDGVEAEASFRFTKQFNAGVSFAYSNGRIASTAAIPCNGPAGYLSVSTATPIYTCMGGPASFAPRWTLSVHSEYTHDVTDTTTGYVRTQGTINPANLTNPGSPYDTQAAYAMFNAYLGVKSKDGLWDLSFFVKNLTNTKTILSSYGGNLPVNTSPSNVLAAVSAMAGVSGASLPLVGGYSLISTTPPRQFGATLRVAFGSK